MPQKKSTALAVHKETISPERALQLLQQGLSEKFDALKTESRGAAKEIVARVGGQFERLDHGVVEQGRAFAQRLSLIARTQAGSSDRFSYRSAPSKTAAPIAAVAKKIYACVAELEAIVANDIEIPLFASVSAKDFFDNCGSDIRKFKAKDLVDVVAVCKGPDEAAARSDEFIEAITEEFGDDAAREAAREILAQFQIEIPADEEEQTTPRRGKKAPSRHSVVDGAEYDDPDHGDGEDAGE